MSSGSAFRPSTVQELAEFIGQADSVVPTSPYGKAAAASNCSLENLAGITEYSPADQVVKCLAGTSLDALQLVLREHRQAIPVFSPNYASLWGAHGSWLVGDLAAWNLPHSLAAQHGTWRDWLLGAKMVLASGSVVKSGAAVVKSVAGYDVHRLFVGARHTLGIFGELTLRTCPLQSLQKPMVEVLSPEPRVPDTWAILRSLPTDFDKLVSYFDGKALAIDSASSTIYLEGCIESGTYDEVASLLSKNLVIWSSESPRWSASESFYIHRLKAEFDPDRKLNPGAFGVI